MLSDKLQKFKQVGNSIDLPIPVESVVQTLHLNRSKYEEKKNEATQATASTHSTMKPNYV